MRYEDIKARRGFGGPSPQSPRPPWRLLASMAAMAAVCLFVLARFGGADRSGERVEPDKSRRKLDREATLLFVQYPEAELTGVNPHRYRERPVCQRCHRGGTAALLDAPIELCARCHPGPHPAHATDLVQPRDALRARLPLGPGDRVLCHTCHEHHDVNRRPGGLRLDREALCVACHEAR